MVIPIRFNPHRPFITPTRENLRPKGGDFGLKDVSSSTGQDINNGIFFLSERGNLPLGGKVGDSRQHWGVSLRSESHQQLHVIASERSERGNLLAWSAKNRVGGFPPALVSVAALGMT
jgi:hypothetical protein